MRKILIFTKEPEYNDYIANIRSTVIFGFEKSYNNALSILVNKNGDFYIDHPNSNILENKHCPIIIFNSLKNYNYVKKFSDIKTIKAITLLKTGIINDIPNTLVFICDFPISDIPINEIHKFRIIIIS